MQTDQSGSCADLSLSLSLSLSPPPHTHSLRSFQPVSSCPMSPPSPSSSQHSSSVLSQYLSRHHHCTQSDNTSPHISSPTKLGDASAQQTGLASKTSSRSRSPILSEQLFLRRGSTPVTLSFTKTSRGGSLSAKSSYLAGTRSSFHSVTPVVRTVTTPPATATKASSPRSGEGLKEHPSREFGLGEMSLKVCDQGDCKVTQMHTDACEVQGSGGLGKGPVNRQDSGIGTLSTTSNKCDFRM